MEVALLCFASGATETSPLDFACVCAAAADGSSGSRTSRPGNSASPFHTAPYRDENGLRPCFDFRNRSTFIFIL